MKRMKQLMVYFLVILMPLASMPAQAGIIGTEEMLVQDARSTALATVESFMARDQVVAQLEAWGVSPATAAERAAALSDSELQRLAASINEQPAGGSAVGLVVLVLLVLIILELTGNIDIFKKI
ncbi:MAG: PA2779 family protein [Gammaproteobacteria bacterium]